MSRGTSRYCAKTKLRLTILGNRIEGESWRGADVEGTIDATGHLEAKTYHSGTGFGGEKATFEGEVEEGTITGTGRGERGVCGWSFTLTKKEPS